jgi:putative hydrolase of the HAD superfamily
MINTIFFDIGGVLIDIHPNRTFEYISKCTNIDKKTVEKSFPSNIHNKYEKGLISNNEWFLNYKNSLKGFSALNESDFWIAWKLLLGKEKKTIELIKLLKPYYSIWLLSNTNPQHIRDEIEKKYVFPTLSDGEIYSFEVGERKPSRAIFKVAMKKASTVPEKSLFIDDLIENVDAATEFGIKSFQFRSYLKLKLDFKNINLKGI